ncbi:MAG: hypothetical protein JRF07_09725 [Deltaproteobacteria bacterium]|jgi:hypothetical protein|nr:hypothetical protein [Deltaproteobacteria bacterium]
MRVIALRFFCSLWLSIFLLIPPAISHSEDIALGFDRTLSVKVTKVRVVDLSEHEVTLAGQILRSHRLPMAGHLHVYSYAEDEQLVSHSKHPVLRLNSQRGGSMRLPFKVSVNNLTIKPKRIYLQYHGPGHSKC